MPNSPYSHKSGAEQHPSTELEAEAKPRAEHQPSTNLVSESKPLWKEKDVEGDVSEFMDSTFASRYTAQPIKKNQWVARRAALPGLYCGVRPVHCCPAAPPASRAWPLRRPCSHLGCQCWSAVRAAGSPGRAPLHMWCTS